MRKRQKDVYNQYRKAEKTSLFLETIVNVHKE